MKTRPFLLISGTIFLIVAVAHLTRLFTGFDVVMGGHTVPHWASYPGLLVPGALAVWAFRLASRSGSGA